MTHKVIQQCRLIGKNNEPPNQIGSSLHTPRVGMASRSSEEDYMSRPAQLIRCKQLAARLGIHRATVWRWAKQGRLPKPVNFSRNVTAWRLSDIEAFVAARTEGGP